MKNFTTFKALALSLLVALPAIATAKHYEEREYYRDEDSGCCGTPLFQCGWSLEVHGGIAPILWNNRDCFQLANAVTGTTTNGTQLTALGGLPSFRNLYRLPWDVGFRVGYAVCENVEATLEFDYRQASARLYDNGFDCCATSTAVATVLPSLVSLCYYDANPADGTTTLSFNNLTRYQSYNGHVGARWYSPRYWCDSVSFFIGTKVGFSHHKQIDVTVTKSNQVGSATAVTEAIYSCTPLYFRNTTISAGGLVGFDYCFWNRVSFVFQAEFLGQGPLNASHNIGSENCNECDFSCDTGCGVETPACTDLSTAATATTNLVGANFNTEVVFPILFGLKYYF
jgi:hypothetical protein